MQSSISNIWKTFCLIPINFIFIEHLQFVEYEFYNNLYICIIFQNLKHFYKFIYIIYTDVQSRITTL